MLTPSDQRLWEWFTRNLARCTRSYATVRVDDLKTVLDLHDLTLEEAYRSCKAYLEEARRRRYDSVVIVTGRSGRIRIEFPEWAHLDRNVKRIRPLEGDGAFKVTLNPV